VRPDELERRLRERLDALGPAPRAELLHVLILPDFERADRIGEFWGYAQSRAFAEVLIDCEEGRRRVLLTLPSGQPRPVEATDIQNGIKHPMVAILRKAARQSIGVEGHEINRR
jgi:hypothetical protein